jgi:hypothetical protein
MTLNILSLNFLSLNLTHLIVIGLILCLIALIVYIIAPTTLPTKKLFEPHSGQSKNPVDFFKTNAIIAPIKTFHVDNDRIQMVDLGNGKIFLYKDYDYYPCPENEKVLNEILNSEVVPRPQNIEDVTNQNSFSEKQFINSTYDDAREMEEIFQNANPDDFNYSLQRELNEEASKIEVKEPEIITQENEENDQFHFSFEVDDNPNNNI